MQPGDGRQAFAQVAGDRRDPDGAREGLVMARKTKPMTVVAGVERDLAGLPGELGISGLALSALELARQMDGLAQPAAKASCGRALARALKELRAMSPVEQTDTFDEIAARRAARVAKGAG
jgi:hypothetical protein